MLTPEQGTVDQTFYDRLLGDPIATGTTRKHELKEFPQ